MTKRRYPSRRPGFSLIAALGVALFAGCTGEISEPGAQDGFGGFGSGASNGSTKAGLVATPRLARLTHTQWENSVRDLLGITSPEPLFTEFPKDPKTAGFLFDNDAGSLSVDQALWSAYQRATDAVIERLVGDSVAFQKLLPPDTGDADARARSLIADLGMRAYRRPLTQAEKDELLELFQSAPSLYAGVAPFEAGVRLLLQAVLQSPLFLYRIEASKKVVGDAIPLDGYELASRLSYTLINSMPDAALLAAASAGKLATASGVEAEARRLLDDPRAEKVVTLFHHALFDGSKMESIKPFTSLFPEVSPTLGASALMENELFVRDQFESGGGFRELLTSTTTFVNADLAFVYGLTGSFGTGFEKVQLDAKKRRGIFTQVGFLAANATAADPDPIHRGAYLARRIACIDISAPPGNVPPLPAASGKTNRENVQAHTETPGSVCANCHTEHINPFGFPFENYDAVGAWRDDDNGQPVDATASPLLDDTPTAVTGAVELAEKLAASPAAHRCYAEHWLEYTFGRKSVEADAKTISEIGELSRGGAGIKDVIAKLVVSRGFLNRAKEQLK
ncbi:MAG: DUF1592 domain-containing protein [Myxococcales bacterium]|nr:DUF1592 domain-containing protein [Myxococcales bacterium]